MGSLLADLGGAALGDTLKQFVNAAATGNAAKVAAVVGGLSGGPLLAIGILAAGVALQVSGKRKDKKAETEAWAELSAQLASIQDDQSALTDLLTRFAERHDHFLARLPGSEKAELAEWVAEEVKKAVAPLMGGAASGADWDGLRTSLGAIHQRLADLAGAVAEVRGAVADVHTDVREVRDILTTGRARLPSIPQGIAHNFAIEGIVPNADFVGRADLLARVHRALTGGRTTTLTHALSADGGVGKTETANAYVFDTEYVRAWRGIWWLDASPVGFDASLERLLAHVGFPRKKGQTTADLWHEFVRRIGGQRHLVVFDNVEEAAFLREFVVPDPARVLATTRLSPENLGQAAVIEVDLLDRDDAKRLLVMHRADLREDGRGGLPSAAHDGEIGRIAEHLGDHALAVALAAAALRYDTGLSPADLLDRLQACEVGGDDDPLCGVGADQTGRRYARSVAEALLLHLPALQAAVPLAPAVLLLASLCHGQAIPFPLIAACFEKSEQDVRGAVLALRDRSMIRFDAGSGVEKKGLVSIHRLTQSAMRARAGADDVAGAAEALRAALRGVFADPADVQAWARQAEALPHARAVLARPASAGAEAAVAFLNNQVGGHLNALGRAAEAEPLFRQALEMRQRLFKGDHPALAASLNNLAVCRCRQGRWDDALPLHEAAVAMARRCLPPGHPDLATWEGNLASARRQRGGG